MTHHETMPPFNGSRWAPAVVPPVVPPSIGWLFSGFCLPVFAGTVVILVRNLPRNWVRCCSCGHNLPTDTPPGWCCSQGACERRRFAATTGGPGQSVADLMRQSWCKFKYMNMGSLIHNILRRSWFAWIHNIQTYLTTTSHLAKSIRFQMHKHPKSNNTVSTTWIV